MASFADALTARTRALGHPLCIGLDPYLGRIPRTFHGASEAETVRTFLLALLEIAAGKVAIVKPQIALFERLGIPGLEALRDVVARAKQLGLLVLLDAKRGDIGATARGYAEAYLRSDGFLDVDALTVSPYMGADTIEPFVEVAQANGKGVFVLVRNSNPGSDAFQRADVAGAPHFALVAAALRGFERRLLGTLGWSSLGATVSAASPGDAQRVRRLLPHALLLVLGFGAQGGSAGAALAGLTRGAHGFEGGLVNSSRAVLYPEPERTGAAWEAAVAAAIAAAIRELRPSAAAPVDPA